uniref:BCL2 like 2 n=1 Tax=Bos taurus TaxID=9913 RepID=A0ABI0NUA0_BOVIN
MATPASAPDTRALVADFVGYKLRQKGYVCGAGPGEGPAADPLHQAMRAAGDEFETRFRRTFSDLAAQLHVTPGSAQQRFTQVSDELFQGGPNWGRLVAFFVFGAALCAESVNKEMEPLVGQVQEWMVAYLETRLADWIHSSGGWFSQTSEAEMVHEVFFGEILSNCDSAPSSPVPEKSPQFPASTFQELTSWQPAASRWRPPKD